PLPSASAAVRVSPPPFAPPPVLRLGGACRTPVLPSEPLSLRRLFFRSSELRTVAAANLLWEFSFAGLKSFIVLYVVKGLGRSPAIASADIAVLAVRYVAAAPPDRYLPSRYAIALVLRCASPSYGLGLVLGVFPHSLTPMVGGLPVVALAGAVVMTLPGALAFSVVPRGSEGAAAGLQDFSRGIGVVAGPIVVGAAIDVLRGLLPSTH